MKNLITNLLKDYIDDFSIEEINCLIEIPPKQEMGDYAFPCFKLASVYKKSPQLIAKELCDRINKPNFISDINVLGSYINFYLNKCSYAKYVIDRFDNDILNNELSIGKGKSIVIDYSSPNIAKKFHIGHLRTTIIGNSLYRTFSFLGYKCIGINHLGDWGTQFGKLIVSYKLWGDKDKILSNGIDELIDLYVKFHDEAENNPELNDQARAWFVKMEKGDKEALEIWKWFIDISLVEYKKIYNLLNIEFDSYAGESFYNDKMEDVVSELEDNGLIEISDGAKIVDLANYDMPPCLITKSDGSTLYATRDITAALYRKNTYDFEKCLYVTGLEQKLHFSQWFKVINLMGYDWSNKLVHIPYGMVSMNTGKLSTRKGNVILVDNLLNESIEKTSQIINENDRNLENKDEIAKQIGIGAIIFNDLYNSRIKDVIFSWDKVLNFDGETGPYVQYTHARAASVLRKVDNKIDKNKIDFQLLNDDISFSLIKVVDRFINVVIDASDKYEPYIIARYAVELAQNFNRFYHNCPIIVDDEKLMNTRLYIVYVTKYIIKKSLYLLGIESPEQM